MSERHDPGSAGDTPSNPRDEGSENAAAANSKSTESEKRLISSLLSGEISDADRVVLLQRLAEEPSLFAEYKNQAYIHAILRWSRGKDHSPTFEGVDPLVVAEMLADSGQIARLDALHIEEGQALTAGDDRALPESVVLSSASSWRNPISAVACLSAAVIAILGFATFFRGGTENPSVGPQEVVVAESESTDNALPPPALLVASVDAELRAFSQDSSEEILAQEALEQGAWCPVGKYHLERGLVKLEYRSGVSVLIEAPATFALVNSGRLSLDTGLMTANVPEEGVGFTVVTPNAKVVDLGTEFGVDARGDGSTCVLVFKGEVDLAPLQQPEPNALESTPNRVLLRKGDGFKSSPEEGLESCRIDPQRFFREVPTASMLDQKRQYEKWLSYCEELSSDRDVLVHYRFSNQRPDDNLLINHSGDGESLHGVIHGADWQQGRWPFKQSLRFSNSGAPENKSVEVSIPGSYSEITVAAWLYLESVQSGYTSILMSSHYNRPGDFHWQINPDKRLHVGHNNSAGEILQSSFDSMKSIANTKLGAWRHVAVTINKKATSAQFYLDGEPLGAKCRIAPTPCHMLLLDDMQIGDWDSTEYSGGPKYNPLDGLVDELIIIKRSLTGDEIRKHYEAGRPQ